MAGVLPDSPQPDLSAIWKKHLGAAPPVSGDGSAAAALPPATGVIPTSPTLQSPPPMLRTHSDLTAIWAKHGIAPAAKAVKAPDTGRGVVSTVLDPFGTTGELGKGLAVGGRNIAGAVGRLFGADEFAARMLRTPEGLAPSVESFTDISGPQTAAKYVYSLLGQSLPEMGAVTAAGIGGAAVGGPAAGLAAAYATSTAFNTGRNLARQEQETGQASYGKAFGAGLLQAAPDVFVPGRIGGLFTDRLSGIAQQIATRPGREIAIDTAAESATEVMQQGIEIAQADPENARIMFNPQTPEEMAESDRMWSEIMESAVGGAAAGGTLSTGATAVRGGGAEPPAEAVSAPGAPPAGGPPAAAPAAPAPFTDKARLTVSPDSGDTGYYRRLGQRESGNDPNAAAAGSSALGKFQFVDGTWLTMVAKYRPDLLARSTEADVLDMRRDQHLEFEMVQHLTRENGAALRAANLPVNGTTLYAAHHFGSGGARKLFASRPTDKVSDVFSADVIKANPYLKGMTVADLVRDIQNDFGAGAPDMTPPPSAAATIQTADDKTGDALPDAEPVRQKNAMREIFAEEFENTLGQEMPRISDRLLDERLMGPTTTQPILPMVGIANGTIQLGGMTLSESTAVGKATLERFGYALDRMKPGEDFGAPNFRPVNVDLATAPLVAVGRKQFNPEDTSSLAHSPFADEALPQTLEMLAKAADRTVGKHDNDVAHKKRGVSRLAANAKQRRDGSALRRLAEIIHTAREGKPVQGYDKDVTRAMEALQRLDTAAFKAMEGLLRSYRAASDLGAIGKPIRGKSTTEAGKHMQTLRNRAGVVARLPALQFDYGAATKGGKVPRSRIYSDVVSQRLSHSQSIAEDRYKRALNAELKAREASKQTREDTLQTEEREASTADTKQAGKAALDAYIQSMREKAEVGTGSPGGTGTATTAMMTPPKKPPKPPRIRGAAQRLMMGMMTLRQIATVYTPFLAKVRVGRSLHDIATAVRLVFEAGDKEGRAIINLGNQIGLRMSGLGPVKLKALGATMNDATTYEMTPYANMAAVTPMDRDTFKRSLLTSKELADLDGITDPALFPPPGKNAHIPPARRPRVLEIYDGFMKLDAEQRRLYLDARNFYMRARQNTLDIIVRNIATQYLGPNSEIRTSKDAEKAIADAALPRAQLRKDALSDKAIAAFQAILKAPRLKGDYFKLDRDSGNWSVYASQTIEYRAPTLKEALAKRKAATDADPTLQTMDTTEEGNEKVVRARREFYKVYDRESTAKVAVEKLRRGDTGSPTFKPDHVSNAELRSDHLWQHDVPPQVLAVLQDVVKTMQTSPNGKPQSQAALVDALNSILSSSNRAAVRLGRDNVLGASENAAEILRSSAVRSGLQVRTLHANPEVQRITEEAEEQIKKWSTEPLNAEKGTQSRAVLNHIDRLNAARQALFNPTLWRTVGRTGSSAAVVWYLSSASYFMLNLTQPTIYGVPFMSARYGAAGGRELMLHNARLLKMLPGAIWGTATEGQESLQERVGKFKDVELRDPADPLRPLEGRESKTVDPLTGDLLYLNNTRSEYDEFARGEIDLAHLTFLSETRKRGAFGATFYEAPDEFTQIPDPDPVTSKGEIIGDVAATVSSTARKTLDWMVSRTSAMAEHIEYVNRRAVVDAVYKLEQKKAPGVPMNADRIAELANIADELTYQVNVDYSAPNRTLMHQSAGPLLLFTSFGFHFAFQTWRAFKAATLPGTTPEFTRKQGAAVFLGLVGVHMALSGVQAGVPQWMQPGIWAGTQMMTMAADLFGWGDDDDDEPQKMADLGFWEYSKMWVRENLGDSAADVMFNGVPAAAFGVDLSGRLTLNELYTFVDLAAIMEGEDEFKDVAFSMLGPVPAIATDIMRAYSKLGDGGMSGPALLETFSPFKIGRDIGKALALDENGMRTRDGKVLLEPEQIEMMDVLIQATGFTPEEIAAVRRKRDIEYNTKTPIAAERDRVFTRLKFANTPTEERTAKRLRREFNVKYPDFAITASGWNSSRRSTREAERDYRRTGGVSREDRSVADLVKRIEGGPRGD